MALIVQKFGGSSLATPEHIRRVAKIIAETKKNNHRVVVVVSAMSGETDRLLNLAHETATMPQERELDALLATGEQVSAALVAIALKSMKITARSYLGLQLPLLTDKQHTRARIIKLSTEELKKTLEQDIVPVVAGFQGVNSNGDITTLGRGGSDTSAVALAAALQADLCEIHSDVDGVYTADPAICPRARHLGQLTYGEMLEMADMGAKILQIRSVELARKFKVPLLIKSSFGSDKCTWIVEEEKRDMESAVISGIILSHNEAKLSVIRVPDRPGVAYQILSPLADASINVDMIIQNASIDGYTDFTFTVPKTDLSKTRELVEKVLPKIGARELCTDDGIVKISAVGLGIKNCPGVAARMFQALANEGINIQMISTSDIRLSCVVEAKYGELAVRVLHDVFGLEKNNSFNPA
ncbi:MAG: aspartate kinase [Dethiobacteria bacterium]|jgi:aspartate kinase|nr:aspartate kinase [Bacillota bacterium]NMD33619.1 aspartate kinase [Bacillota bacterium]